MRLLVRWLPKPRMFAYGLGVLCLAVGLFDDGLDLALAAVGLFGLSALFTLHDIADRLDAGTVLIARDNARRNEGGRL